MKFFNKEKQRFSLRKNKAYGLASALVGITLVGAGIVTPTMSQGSSLAANALTAHAEQTTPRPEGKVIAQGEDGVPWELYENGYLLFTPVTGKDTLTNDRGTSAWKINYGDKIKHVAFAGKVYAPADSSYLFAKLNRNDDEGFNPTSFDTTNLDTSKVSDMSYMFSHLSNLTKLDVTRFDTSKATTMFCMFTDMSSLTSLDVVNFDTSNVTTMNSMFHAMSSLTSLDVTHFDTRQVTSMVHMFSGMTSLTSLDVTHFDTSKVTNMEAMFNYTPKLTKLDVTHFDTSKVTNMESMFRFMYKLSDLDLTNFNTSKVTNMKYMFSEMTSLSNLDVTHFDTSKVVDMEYMFYKMANLTSLDVSNFDTSKVTNSDKMLSHMSKLKELKIGSKFKADVIKTITAIHDSSNQYTEKWHKLNDNTHSYTVEDWATTYATNPTANAGTWVREESSNATAHNTDATISFNGETLPTVKVNSDATVLPDLPRPSTPKPNHKFKGWSKTPNGAPITKDDIKPGESLELYPIWELVDHIKIRTERIPVTKTYEADDALEYGKRNEIPGVEGVKTITTTYTVTPYTGELTNPVDSEVITKQMKPAIVKVGTKPREERTSVELLPVYEKDDTREYGQQNKVVKGSPRVLITSYPYSLDKTTGQVKELAAVRKIIDGTPDRIKVAAKDKEEIFTKEGLKVKKVTSYKVDSVRGTVTSASEYRFAESNSLTLVKKEIVTKDNKKLLRVTTYHIDPHSGKITSSTQYQLMTDDEANKYESTKVEVVKRNGHTVEITEHSYLDANTGEIKTDYTERMLDSTKYDDEGHRIDPPVLDVPVYNGEISDSVETLTKDGMKVKKIIRYVVDKDGNVKSEVHYEFENATGSNKSEYSTTEEFEENGVKIRKITKYTIDKDGNIVKTVTYELVDKSNSSAEFDKVERIIKDGKVIERTTHYKFNPNTGKFEMTTTDKEISETNDSSSSKHDSKDQNQVQHADKESVEIIEKDGVKIKRITYFEKDENGKLVKKVRYELENANSNGEVVITEEVTENGVKLIKKIIITVDKDGNLVKKIVYELADPDHQQAEFDKIEMIEKDGKLIKRTTHYKFNPLTGRFEQTVEEEIISNVDENGQPATNDAKNKDKAIDLNNDKKQALPKTNVESTLGITLSGLLATAGAAFTKLRKKK